MFMQWLGFNQCGLRVIRTLARAATLCSACAQQLPRELVDHQLEYYHHNVTLLDDAQQRCDGVGVWLVVGTDFYCAGIRQCLLLVTHRSHPDTVVQAASLE